jgi:hypothetical protein
MSYERLRRDGLQDVERLAGNYVLANFKFASDGHSGTIVCGPPVANPAIAEGERLKFKRDRSAKARSKDSKR